MPKKKTRDIMVKAFNKPIEITGESGPGIQIGDKFTIEGHELDRKGRLCVDKVCVETNRKVKNTYGLKQFKVYHCG